MLVIIGGAAATLSFGAIGGTIDIDAANKVTGLAGACKAAQKDSKLPIPLGTASVFSAPRDYEKRLKPLALKGLRNLRVLVPELHDWALMKIVRFEDKDLEHLKAAHQSAGLDLGILEERFFSEMIHIEPRSRLLIHFLAAVEELFGEGDAARLQQSLRTRSAWR